MGLVIAPIVSGLMAYGAGTTIFGLTVLQSALLIGASQLALSVASSALAPKPKALSSTGAEGLQSLTRQIRQAITPRRTIYGEFRGSGNYAYIGSTQTNQFLHFIILLADHECQEIGEVWFNDDSIPPDYLDGNGDIITGKYTGKARIIKHLGTPTQAANSDMVGAFSEWTSDHTLSEIAYIYVRLKYDRDVFASGIPNVSAWIRGKKTLDQRVSLTQWSPNPALIIQDYLLDSRRGVGVSESKIDSGFLISSANTCDEFVTTTAIYHNIESIDTAKNILSLSTESLSFQRGDRVTVSSSGTLPSGISALTDYYVIPYQRVGTPRIKLAASYEESIAENPIDITDAGSGSILITKNAEPRYHASAAIESTTERQEALNSLRVTMSGDVIYAGGKWRITSGKYETPTIAFDEDDFAGKLTIRTKTSRRDRFNRIKGNYISPLNNGQPSDYPAVKNDTYKTEDGGEYIDKNYPLNFVPRPHQCMRLAKIELEKSRQEIVISGRFKLSAFRCQIGDNVLMSFEKYGWSNKPFEVIEWSLAVEIEGDTPIPYIDMTLKETASAIYDWNNGEETRIDPAPNTTLPDAFNVAPVTGLSFDSEKVSSTAGDNIYKLILRWNAVEDAFVNQGGSLEVQYRKSLKPDGSPADETDWIPSFFVDGSLTVTELTTASAGTLFDLRIRAVNNIGRRSVWNALYNLATGSGGGVISTDDWGHFHDGIQHYEDWGDWQSAPIATEDWGAFS